MSGDYDHYDYDDGACWNCGGEGFVYGCSWDWQCDTWDGDSCLCSRRCDICNPAPRDPVLTRVLGEALAAPCDSRPLPEWDETRSGSVAEGDRAAVPEGQSPTPHSLSTPPSRREY